MLISAFPLPLHFSQHHKKIRLGHASKWGRLLRFNAGGLVDADGELEDEAPMTTTKLSGVARGCFGDGVRRRPDGRFETGKMPPKNYSGMQVAAPKRWAQLEAAGLVRPTKGGKDWKPLGWPWTAKKAEGGKFLG